MGLVPQLIGRYATGWTAGTYRRLPCASARAQRLWQLRVGHLEAEPFLDLEIGNGRQSLEELRAYKAVVCSAISRLSQKASPTVVPPCERTSKP